MLSEAVTIVLADMIFVDTLRKDSVEYDWSKRKIWPLFNDMLNTKDIKGLIKTNVKYCLMGDDSDYPKGVHLDNFKEKYMPFFVEDYKWTERNWNNMTSKKEQFTDWWENVQLMRDHATNKDSFGKLETVTEYIERNNIKDAKGIDNKSLIITMFDNLFNEDILPYLNRCAILGKTIDCVKDAKGIKDINLNNPIQISNNAFSRWLIGQMFIFSKFSFLQESKIYSNKIKNTYLNKDYFSILEINAIRSLYEQYLSILQSKNLISKDDENVYAETFPIFDPSFASYDKGIDFYEDLNNVWKNILS